eukprot:scaffold7956_cov32-Tisochrysis_lutea.AAC.5
MWSCAEKVCCIELLDSPLAMLPCLPACRSEVQPPKIKMAPSMVVAEWRHRAAGGFPRTSGCDQLQLRVSRRCTS